MPDCFLYRKNKLFGDNFFNAIKKINKQQSDTDFIQLNEY